MEEDYSVEISDEEEKGGTGGAKKDDDTGKKPGKKQMNPILEWVLWLGGAMAIALFINFFIIINATVPTGSMEDTIPSHSRIIGWRLAYISAEPQRGDIVVFKYPDDPSETFVKRIVGMPGDEIEIIDGCTYINGIIYNEPYLKETPYKNDYGPFIVPEDCYFVMGDNRNNSNDARFWTNKYVSKDAILGKAVFCYWPLSSIGALE